jgi:hypothetical protein
VGLTDCGEYNWSISVKPKANGDLVGYLLSTQLINISQSNDCNEVKTPVIGTVQPFVHNKNVLHTTSSLVTTLEHPRYAITVELFKGGAITMNKVLDLEISVVITRVRNDCDLDEFPRC